MTDRYHSDTQEKIESITYQPGLQNSGDIESGTRTVTATAEATGLGNADYSAALTLPKPSDARLRVLRIAARLAVTIDSKTAAQLNCRVYVDVQDSSHRLFDLFWATTGAQLAAVDTHDGNLPAVFGLLKDGQPHTFYFFFWVNAGNAVVSLCQLWEGVGSCDTGWWGKDILALDFRGWVSTCSRLTMQGTGTFTHWLSDGAFTQDNFIKYKSGDDVIGYGQTTCCLAFGPHVWAGTSVATDIACVFGCSFVLRKSS